MAALPRAAVIAYGGGMATVFTKIIDGQIPGRFVWADDQCVAFLTAEPLRPGHILVVPRLEIDHWIDLEPDLAAHLLQVAHTIGRAQMAAFNPKRIGLLIEGYGVPHAHLHVWPSTGTEDFNPASADPAPDPQQMDASAQRLRDQLRADGHGQYLPA